jgi:hypothetical protein
MISGENNKSFGEKRKKNEKGGGTSTSNDSLDSNFFGCFFAMLSIKLNFLGQVRDKKCKEKKFRCRPRMGASQNKEPRTR